jgi:hypothetical protein
MMDEGRVEELLQAATQAIEAGDLPTGRRLLGKVLKDQPDNEMAWLWLAVAVESVDQRKECLERVLALNPNNRAALETLAEINRVNLPPQESVFSRSELAPDEDIISPSGRAEGAGEEGDQSTIRGTGGLRNRLLHRSSGWSSQSNLPPQPAKSPIPEPPSQPIPPLPETYRAESTIPGLNIDREEAAEIKSTRVSLRMDWEGPREMLSDLTSRARQDRSGRMPLILGVGLALIALLVLWFSVRGFGRSLESYRSLVDYGVAAPAEVVNLTGEPDAKGVGYAAEYTYTVRMADGSQQVFTRIDPVSIQIAPELQPGTTVQIRYLPSDPQLASLESELAPPTSYPSFWVAGLSLVLLLVALGVIFYGLGVWMPTVRLDRRGKVAHGVIVDRWSELQQDGDPLNLLAFRYEVAANSRHTPRAYTRGQPVSKETYQQSSLGGKVLVRYLPEAPGEGRLIE